MYKALFAYEGVDCRIPPIRSLPLPWPLSNCEPSVTRQLFDDLILSENFQSLLAPQPSFFQKNTLCGKSLSNFEL
jgi:hypothetical protein